MFFFIDIFFIEKVRKKIFFLFLAYPPPQIDVQREIKADADFLCQFLPEFNISMDPSDVLCNVFLSEVDIIMDPSIVLYNVFLPELKISMDPSDVLCNVLLSELDIIMDPPIHCTL